MIRTLSFVLAVLPGSLFAQTANTPEMHNVAIATFNVACIATAPDLDAAANAFKSAGMAEVGDGVFNGFGEQVVGFTKVSPDGKTRTCAVGLLLGLTDVLMLSVNEIAPIAWGSEFQTVDNPGTNPVLMKRNDTWVAAMTVVVGENEMPIMNHLSVSPSGEF